MAHQSSNWSNQKYNFIIFPVIKFLVGISTHRHSCATFPPQVLLSLTLFLLSFTLFFCFRLECCCFWFLCLGCCAPWDLKAKEPVVFLSKRPPSARPTDSVPLRGVSSRERKATLHWTQEPNSVLVFSRYVSLYWTLFGRFQTLCDFFMAGFVRKSRGFAQHVEGGAIVSTLTADCLHLGFKMIVCWLLLIYHLRTTHFKCKCCFFSLRLPLHHTGTHSSLHYISLTVLNSKILHLSILHSISKCLTILSRIH